MGARVRAAVSVLQFAVLLMLLQVAILALVAAHGGGRWGRARPHRRRRPACTCACILFLLVLALHVRNPPASTEDHLGGFDLDSSGEDARLVWRVTSVTPRRALRCLHERRSERVV